MATSCLFTILGCTKSSSDSSSDIIGNWITGSDFDGNARSEAVTFTINGNAYLTTGSTNRDRFADLWEYDINKKYWTQKANFPGAARNSAVAFVIGDKGYVGTGYDGNNYLKDFYEYDPSTHTWTQKADFGGTARYDAVAFSLDNNGYVSCGFDGNYLKDLWQYTPGANASDPGTWTQKASIGGTKRSAASSFVLNGIAYIVSGNNNGTVLNDLWSYDASTDTWTEKRKIANLSDDSYDDKYSGIGRYNAVCFVMNSRAYLTLGENPSMTSTTWEYNDATDLWVQKTDFEGSVRTGAVAFTLDDRGFVLTGRSGTTSYDNMFEFHPNEDKVDND
jgi:N-acetylneuraminic acid mutarotase